MSAILSADDLNDFISPGVACIKPVETLPRGLGDDHDPYQVTTEEQLAESQAPPAQISLTDCLACSGCVTSAEAVLVSLQSHGEVASTLSKYASVGVEYFQDEAVRIEQIPAKILVATVSPQACASLAATYRISRRSAQHMIEQLLAGPKGLKSANGKGFTHVLDSDAFQHIARMAVIEETVNRHGSPRRPVLASACPGWICYAEKTHPYILPYLSKIKSPQALAGTLVKSVLARKYNVPVESIWHVAVMPCFDKKLEASREELTDTHWSASTSSGVRDVDCVITARELILLADSQGIHLPALPNRPINRVPFPDRALDELLFRRKSRSIKDAGPSGGYAYELAMKQHRELPGSAFRVSRGRNADVVEYHVEHQGRIVLKTARYYGFRNIQNLVRKLKPKKAFGKRLATKDQPESLLEYAYVEVMACPGGCTNGGGQVKAQEVPAIREGTGSGATSLQPPPAKEWLAAVDEAYFSEEQEEQQEVRRPSGVSTADDMDIDSPEDGSGEHGTDSHDIGSLMLDAWIKATRLPADVLTRTSYRAVAAMEAVAPGSAAAEASDMQRVAGLASAAGGGW